jgi:peptidoglycan/LPS O-acetylase OafA/YrhL
MWFLLGEKAEFSDAISYLASNLVFANFLQPDMGGLLADLHNQAINPSLWTLKIEVMFYLLVPIIFWAVKRFGLISLTFIYLSSTAYFLLTHGHSDMIAKQLPSQLRFFVIGIYLYSHPIILHYAKSNARDKLDGAIVVFIGCLLLLICSLRSFLLFAPLYPIFLGSAIFVLAFRAPTLPIKNDISYGVYLIHAPLIQLSLLLGFYQDSLLFLLMLVVVVLELAFIAEKLVELPMIKLGKKLAKKYE